MFIDAGPAQDGFEALQIDIQIRMKGIFKRLEQWPVVSGAKPLRYGLAGQFSIRTGHYRVIFSVDEEAGIITIDKVGHRDDVYEE